MTNDERDRMIRETHDTTITMNQMLEDHVQNPVIHQVPPCEHQKNLSGKLWALLMLVVGSIVASLAAHIK